MSQTRLYVVVEFQHPKVAFVEIEDADGAGAEVEADWDAHPTSPHLSRIGPFVEPGESWHVTYRDHDKPAEENTFTFEGTRAEVEAYAQGVAWVNDSALTILSGPGPGEGIGGSEPIPVQMIPPGDC